MRVPYRTKRKVREIEASSRDQKEVEIPQDLIDELRSALAAYLPEKTTAIAKGVYAPGASEPFSAEVGAYQHAWKAYTAAWRMFGLGATKEQVGNIAWARLGLYGTFARGLLELPRRPEDVASWLWKLVNGGE